jgi:ATP-binding cassette subfamily A (ABC1) protein 3
MFPFIILMSFIFIVILTAKEIVHEKETGIKEAMKLMGMSSWVYWLSWYIKMQMLLIPSIIITVISFTVQLPSATGTGTAAIINKTSPVVIAIFLFLYSSSLTTFTLMCSTLFKKSNSAAAGTAIIYFLTYMPNNVISLQFQNINPIVKILLCLVNNLAMSIGIELIGIFEGFGTGIHFFNLSKGVNEDDYFSLGHVFLLLFLDNFLHMFLIFYFDNLFPGEHGIAKPWNFIFLRFVNKKEKKIQSDSSNTDTNINMNYFEDDSIYSSRKIGIKIYQISKFYQHLNEKKIAIENLNLNIYEGHITVLLGNCVI